MKRIYGKTARELMIDYVKVHNVQKDAVISKQDIKNWFAKNYPKIKVATVTCHITKMTTNNRTRIHYSPKSDGADDLFFQLPNGFLRLHDHVHDPAPIYENSTNVDIVSQAPTQNEGGDDTEFAYEKDLQNFLSKNLSTIEEGLTLYENEGINGIEFPVGDRFIDILAVDKNNNLVVIELKVSKGYDRVVGQILRYMAWIKTYQADDDQSVRGIIVAKEISEDLLLACSSISNIVLYEYQLSVTLKRICNKLKTGGGDDVV